MMDTLEGEALLIDTQTHSQLIPKVSSGVLGLDQLLRGGLPQGRVTQVRGGPGCGKTIFGLEFLMEGVRGGEPGMMVAFEEDAAGIRRNALSLGWELARHEEENKLFIFDAVPDPDALTSGPFDLKGLIALLEGQAKLMRARRVVIDGLDGLLRFFPSRREERDQLQRLLKWLSTSGMTVVLTTKTAGSAESHDEFLDFLCDCVIRLDQRVRGQVTTRRLRVAKYRGSGFGGNEYPYTIGEDGITLLPMTTLALSHDALGEHIGTGNKVLDTLLDGGFRRRSCVLVSGTSGTGKTTLACTFAQEAARRGEKTLYVNFEESETALASAMLSAGIDLRPALEEGKLRTLTAMPEEQGAEEHLVQALRTIGNFSPQNLVVDAISAAQRMSDDQAAFEYLVRLVNFCKANNITVLLTNQASLADFERDLTGIGFSSLVDAIILLQFARTDSEMKRTLLIWKSRGSAHSNHFHEYRITGRGMEIDPQLAPVRPVESGALAGTFEQRSLKE